MKIEKQTKDKKFLQIYLPIILCICGIVYIVSDKDITVNSIAKNREYSIATIIKYSGPGIKHSSSSLRIAFYDSNRNADIETVAYLGTTPRDVKNKIGDRYVVIYNRNNPEQCILLAEYPIIDSLDFMQYKESFKSSPPDLNKYYKLWWNKK